MSKDEFVCQDQAETAAILEVYLYDHDNPDDVQIGGTALDEYGLNGFEIVDAGTYYRQQYKSDFPEQYACLKAVTVRKEVGVDANGNKIYDYYVHFNGTGDGNWRENGVAFGPVDNKTTSSVQEWSVDYFDGIYEKYMGNATDGGHIYVSGHSQGGNNSEFVTLRSKYGEHIDNCITLDGPELSKQSVEEAKLLYGNDHYEQQRNKIIAYRGQLDYVNPLGQTQHYTDSEIVNDVIPKDNIYYVDYDLEKNHINVELFHSAKGLVSTDKDGKLHLNGVSKVPCDFQKFIQMCNDRIVSKLPDEQIEDALSVMAICESLIGDKNLIKGNLTQNDIDILLNQIVPVFLEVIEENPELFISALANLGIDSAYAEALVSLVTEINKLDPEIRSKALQVLGECIVIENGTIVDFDLKPLLSIDGIAVGDTLLHLIINTLIHHPDDVIKVLNEMGIFDYLAKHPAQTVVILSLITLALPKILPFIADIAVVVAIVHGIYHIIQEASEFIEGVKNFVLNVLTTIEGWLGKVKSWYNNTFNKGYKYSNAHPYISVDTVKLRSYASRIGRVNQRLKNLDSEMRSLYSQVGFLDLLDILVANLITCESYTLKRVQSYLNDAGDIFDTAESTAGGYIGR